MAENSEEAPQEHVAWVGVFRACVAKIGTRERTEWLSGAKLNHTVEFWKWNIVTAVLGSSIRDPSKLNILFSRGQNCGHRPWFLSIYVDISSDLGAHTIVVSSNWIPSSKGYWSCPPRL